MHHLASRSEVDSECDAVMDAWNDVFDGGNLRRAARWIDLPIEADTIPGLPRGWTAMDILVNKKVRVRTRMVQLLAEAGDVHF